MKRLNATLSSLVDAAGLTIIRWGKRALGALLTHLCLRRFRPRRVVEWGEKRFRAAPVRIALSLVGLNVLIWLVAWGVLSAAVLDGDSQNLEVALTGSGAITALIAVLVAVSAYRESILEPDFQTEIALTSGSARLWAAGWLQDPGRSRSGDSSHEFQFDESERNLTLSVSIVNAGRVTARDVATSVTLTTDGGEVNEPVAADGWVYEPHLLLDGFQETDPNFWAFTVVGGPRVSIP